MLLEMSRKNRNFLDGQDQWGQPGEEHWYAVEALNANGGRRISTVSYCKA